MILAFYFVLFQFFSGIITNNQDLPGIFSALFFLVAEGQADWAYLSA